MRAVVFVICFSIAILAALPGRVAAVQTVNLAWVPSPSPDVAGYNVHYGLQSGVYTETFSAGSSSSVVIPGLVEGLTYYFVVTAYDSAGEESDPSNEADYTVPGIAPPSAPSVLAAPTGGAAVLEWNPSPSLNAVGYNVYSGSESGSYPELLFSGDATTLALPALAPGTTGYYIVMAFDADGWESDATPEVSFTAPPAVVSLPVVVALPLMSLHRLGQISSIISPPIQPAVVVAAPVLSLRQTPTAVLPGVFSITASGTIPSAWAVEGSTDLQSWATLTTGSNSPVNVTVVVSPKPRLFFRVGSAVPGVTLQTQTPTNAFPHSFSVHTAAVSSAWTVQASEDLLVWSNLTSGTGAAVNMAVVTADTPALYFRLKSL